MGLIKVAFLGMHYRKLGKNERAAYAKDNEKVNNYLFKHPVAKGIKTGIVGVLGGIAGAGLGKEYLASKSKGAVIGGLIGGGLGYGANELDIMMNNRRIKKIKDPKNKWLVFGKGKSHLDK